MIVFRVPTPFIGPPTLEATAGVLFIPEAMTYPIVYDPDEWADALMAAMLLPVEDLT